MKALIAICAISSLTTAFAQPSSVSFTNAEANHILDSLKSRGDWLRAYQIRHSQYIMAREHIADLDSTIRNNNQQCDSTFNADLREKQTMAYVIGELEDAGRRVPWIITLATLIGLVAGLVLGQ